MWDLATKETKPAMRSGINAGLSVLAKGIRQAVPARYKKLRRTVGKSFKRVSTGAGQYTMTAKVGFAVAKKRAKMKAITNVAPHWVILGTKKRIRKTIGGKFSWVKRPSRAQRTTGRMSEVKIVRAAFTASVGAATKATRDGVLKYIERKAARKAAKK
jgi:hypothetical protein